MAEHPRVPIGVTTPHRSLRHRRRLPAIAVLVSLSVAVIAPPVWAASDATSQSSVFVQQALSYLVNGDSAASRTEALMLVNQALAAQNAEGTDLAQIRQAKDALRSGATPAARKLLQSSISAAVAAQKPATGQETGTTIVLAPLAPRAGLAGWDWAFLVLSVLVGAIGFALSFALRPRESLRELRAEVVAAQSRSGGPVSPVKATRS